MIEVFVATQKIPDGLLAKAVMPKAKAALRRGVLKAGQGVFRLAQDHVPVDTGNLRGSGSVAFAFNDPMSVDVSYTAFYGIYVHENLEANFQRPGARAKWLELALKERQSETIKIIADEVGKALQ